jgi:two-component system response regulator YesN
MIKILLVDDEREEREGVAYLIDKYHYPLEVLEAASGKEAVAKLNSNRIDILFTDIKMPVMSGLDLARIARDGNPDIKIIFFSAYADFSFAKTAIELNAVSYLIKPIEIDEFRKLMTDVIESVNQDKENRLHAKEELQKKKYNLMYRIFTGSKVSDETLEEIHKIMLPKNKERFFLINVEFLDNYFENNEQTFIQLAKSYLGSDTEYIGLYPNEAYLVVYSGDLFRNNILEEQLGKLIRDIKGFSDGEAVFLVSDMIHDTNILEEQIGLIHKIKREIFGYDNRIIRIDRYDRDDREYYARDVEIARKQMLSAIESGDVEFIRNHSKGLVEVIGSRDKLSKLYLQNVLYSMIKSLYDKYPNIEMENMLASAEALFGAKNSRNVLEEYETIVDKLLGTISGSPVDGDLMIIKQIKHVVETEYMKDISLNDVADKVNLTPAYVSYIFKKEVGQTLVKYLTDLRMSKAKILLTDQNLKIAKVGQMVGYDNQSYFNRLFKNYYGITPKQFREEMA